MAVKLELREEIRAPVARVYQAITDLEAAREWMPNLVRIEKLTEGPFGAGTRWREVRTMFGREARELFEVVCVEPDRLVELYVDGTKGSSKRGWYRFRWELAPRGEGTELTLRGEIGGLPRIVEWLARLLMAPFQKALRNDVLALKRHVEQGR